MSRSVRRCGRYGAAEKGAKIRSRWGWRCRGKGGAPRRKGAKAGEWRRGLPAFRQSAENRGNFAAEVSADRGLGNVDAVGGQSARSTRQGRPRGSTCLPCCCRRRQGATFRGISGLGEHDAAALIFPRRRSAFAAESRPGREGREKCAERAETRRTRSAAPRKALLRRRDGEFGGEVAPEHACRGQRIGACGRALRRGASAGCFLPDAFRRRAGVRQKTSRFPRRTSCRRAFP